MTKATEKPIDPQLYSVNRGDGTSTSNEKVLESELPMPSTSSVDATKMIQVRNSFVDDFYFSGLIPFSFPSNICVTLYGRT